MIRYKPRGQYSGIMDEHEDGPFVLHLAAQTEIDTPHAECDRLTDLFAAANERVVRWAAARNLIHGSDQRAQTIKLGEEYGELCAAVARGKTDEAVDAIGDMTVVLTILAAQLGTSIEVCQDAAWEQIKDRKGRMVHGVFVKEADQ